MLYKTEDRKNGTTNDVKKTLIDIIGHYGRPSLLTSDNGKPFVEAELKAFMEKWDIEHNRTMAYNPHSNQQAESCVRWMKRSKEGCTDENDELDTIKWLKVQEERRNERKEEKGATSSSQLLLGRETKTDMMVVDEDRFIMKAENILSKEEIKDAGKEKCKNREKKLNNPSKELEKLKERDIELRSHLVEKILSKKSDEKGKKRNHSDKKSAIHHNCLEEQ